MNWRNALIAAAVTLPLLIILALGFNHDPHAVPSVLEGKTAPTFALATSDGKRIELAGLRGKPVVINFWATWCYPCKAEHGLLQEASAHYGDKVQFLGIIYQDGDDEVRKYLAAKPSVYPQLLDPDSRTAIDYGVAGVPESFIINPKGQIVHKQAGVFTADVLQRILDDLVAEKS